MFDLMFFPYPHNLFAIKKAAEEIIPCCLYTSHSISIY